MDFSDEIKRITAQMTLPKPQITATRENIIHRAECMARLGYVPTAESMDAIEAYLQGYGLWLCGKVGTGKTAFFRALTPMDFGDGTTPPKIIIWNMLKTLGESVESINETLESARHDELVLDDVGAEPVFNFYGGKFEILPYILEKRMECRHRTHITTNMSIRDLSERYGVRILDRFSELFRKIEFTGKSRRTPKPNQAIINGYSMVMKKIAAQKNNEKTTRGNDQ